MEQISKNKLSLVSYLIVTILILFVLLITSECEHKKEVTSIKNINESIRDSIKIARNNKGQSTGTTSIIEDRNPDYFLTIQSKDKMITNLQNLVKEYKKEISKQGSITVVASEGTINTTSPTIIDSTDITSPIYSASFKLKDKKGILWAWGNSIARKDSTQINLKYKDSLDLLIGIEKTGFLGLGKGKSFAKVTFHNPYNEVKDMKVYQTQPTKTKRFGIGPTTSYGIGSGLEPQVFIGVGISWDVIQF